MTVYRKVKLKTEDVLSSDLVDVDGRTYQLLGWHAANYLTRSTLTDKASLSATKNLILELQRYDMDNGVPCDVKPIHVIVAKGDLLDVLVDVA